MDRRPSSIAACGQWRPPLLAAPPDLRPVGSSGDGSLCRSHYCSLAFFGLLFSVIQNVHANRAIYIWGQVVFLPAMIFHAPFLFSPSPPSDTQSEEHNKDPTRTFRVQTRFSSGEVRGSLCTLGRHEAGSKASHRAATQGVRGIELRPCLVVFKIPKLYKISHHIESLNACMKY
ncbi:hypothetical protein PVAP13_2KG499700 [Panicum virgatum]|uniref:Uncharacterized protein n=1 Tax=Panicum virgatum TaxID=38727 RepID=A0A8T0W9Z1_PANVG|nr:hypothetical protein PVAP13_2KG499700 [Panicum virgatum]